MIPVSAILIVISVFFFNSSIILAIINFVAKYHVILLLHEFLTALNECLEPLFNLHVILACQMKF